jgi:hypothetical protein
MAIVHCGIHHRPFEEDLRTSRDFHSEITSLKSVNRLILGTINAAVIDIGKRTQISVGQ